MSRSFLQSSIFSGSKNFPEIQEKEKKSRLGKSKQCIQHFVEEGSNSRLQTDIQVCFHRRRCWWFGKAPMRRLTRVRPTHETPRQLIILQHLQKAQVKNKNSAQDTESEATQKARRRGCTSLISAQPCLLTAVDSTHKNTFVQSLLDKKKKKTTGKYRTAKQRCEI